MVVRVTSGAGRTGKGTGRRGARVRGRARDRGLHHRHVAVRLDDLHVDVRTDPRTDRLGGDGESAVFGPGHERRNLVARRVELRVDPSVHVGVASECRVKASTAERPRATSTIMIDHQASSQSLIGWVPAGCSRHRRTVWISGGFEAVDLLAEVGDVDLHDVGVPDEAVLPHRVEDLCLRQDLAWTV